ncbi:MAG: alpha/beta hydrolase [Planctomycetes bacterium]|nr:alpha/beta hydrolase [Planctomycetota bacterium]MCP4770642.1 alpha/beta hydrolase [Planctomycetota bacterium]MCP4861031.1 alpha/beta hydrolase [Planctomycetota bacterium]
MATNFHLQAADGTQLTGYEWRPDGEPTCNVLVIHGQGEHLGRYEYLGEVLAESGVRSIGVDLRGHGMSKGKRGHVKKWSDYVQDVSAAAEMLPETFPVIGHSMGGLIALSYSAAQPQRVRNLVLSGPLMGVAVAAPAWKTAMAGVLSRVLPGLSLASGIPLNELCTDPEAVALYEKDGLRVKTITPRWFTEMQTEIARMRRQLPNFTMPLSLHVAELESIVDAQQNELLYEAWPAAKKRWYWQGGMHEILQEPFRQGVVAAMLEDIRG